MENSIITIKTSQNGSFIFLLTVVWLVLLTLCALIGLLIVPIDVSTDNYFIIVLIGGIKVLVSMVGVVVWLFGWFKGLQYLLLSEFYQSNTNFDPKDN